MKPFGVYPPPVRLSRFRRGWVIAAGIIVAGVLAVAVIVGVLNRPQRQTLANDPTPVVPRTTPLAGLLSGVPKDYGEALAFFRGKEAKAEPPAETIPRPEPIAVERPARRSQPRRRQDDASLTSPLQFSGLAQRRRTDAPSDSESRSFSAQRGAFASAAHGRSKEPMLYAGTVIPASLVTAINSDLPGQIVAQVTAPVRDSQTGTTILIPQGSRLIGTYDADIAYAQSRVLVTWQRLITPSGVSLVLEDLAAVDAAGAAGLRDQVDRHLPGLLGAVALGSVIDGVAAARDRHRRDDGVTVVIANGVDDAGTAITQALTQRRLNVKPTLKIRSGTRFYVFVNRDLKLPVAG